MRLTVRIASALSTTAVMLVLLSGSVTAQGVTSAAVRGKVLDDAGSPVEGATITLVNQSTGQRFQGRSREGGLYNIENVAVGGPYNMRARLIGFQPVTRSGIFLSLGQALALDLTLTRVPITLEAIVVEAEAQDPLTATSRTGTAAFVSDTAVSRLPSLNRSFTDFVVTSPQVMELNPGEGLSYGGGHRKMNNIQIDGISDNDLFGLGDTGQPGGQVDAKSITLEAVKEFQVLIAPFDVRQGGFAGGLVNAITKRGTNTFHGSAFWYVQDDALVRDSLDATESLFCSATAPDCFRQHQRGFSLGGPLVRDKVHFFVAGEWQSRTQPNGGSTIGRESVEDVRVLADSAQRVREVFQNVYGVDPGSFRTVDLDTPNRNIFGRLDFSLGVDHSLALRYNHVDAAGDDLFRETDEYGFSSFNNTIRSNTNSVGMQLNSTLGGGVAYNELRIGYTRIRDRRRPEDLLDRDSNPIRPQIEIENESMVPGQGDVENEFFVGGERFSHRNELDQDVVELDDAFTFSKGRHTIVVGTHNEWISFRNLFFHSAFGRWQFASIADLEAGQPESYFAQIPFTGKGEPVADWSLFQVGVYAQDQFDVTDNLRLSLGLRVDVPILNDEPDPNPDVTAAFGRNTDDMPSGNIHWAPRLGFNWDVTATRATVLRGGAGVFTGRPPYVWLSNAYTNTGREVLEVDCDVADGNMPAFSAAVFTSTPQSCAGGGGANPVSAQVNIFQNDFRLPQTFKGNLGIDQRLPAGLLGTLEFLYTRGLNTVLLKEVNLQGVVRTNNEGRLMFGNHDPADPDRALPARVSDQFVQVLDHTNASEDWSFQFTTQLQKRFSDGIELSAGYTYSKVRDLTSQTSSIATSNFGRRVISRGLDPNDPELATSWFDVPHRIALSGTFNVAIPSLPTSVTFIYTGQSGQPYTYFVDGDANADGYEAGNISGRNNDIVYVPRNATEFTAETPEDFTDFEALIAAEECLSEARGSIPERNTCRNPWRSRLDASLRMSVGRVLGGQRHNLTLVADIFNLLNLLNDDWGLIRTVSFFETNEALTLRGYDFANDRGVYSYSGPDVVTEPGDPEFGEVRTNVNDLQSRWRAQIGLRYDF